MGIIDGPVDEIEYIPREDRGERHPAPVLGQAMHAKRFCDERWIDTEEEAVGHCSGRK